MSDSLLFHGLQHARLPCFSPSPRICSNSCPLSWWCHPTISSSVALFSCTWSFPASGSFPMSQLFTSGDQSIGASASGSILSMSIQGWSLRLTDLISLKSKGLSRVSSRTTVQKHQFFSTQPSLWSNSHIHIWPTGKTIALTIWTFFGKVLPVQGVWFLSLIRELISHMSHSIKQKQCHNKFNRLFFKSTLKWSFKNIKCRNTIRPSNSIPRIY